MTTKSDFVFAQPRPNTDIADARALNGYKRVRSLTLRAMTRLGDIIRPQMHF